MATEAVGFDLSGPDLHAKRMTASINLATIPAAPPYLADKQVTVAAGEKVTFDVVTLAAGGSYDWVIDVTATSSGYVLSVDNREGRGDRPRWEPRTATPGARTSPRTSYRRCTWPDCDAQEAPYCDPRGSGG